jgi:hypothetical protein
MFDKHRLGIFTPFLLTLAAACGSVDPMADDDDGDDTTGDDGDDGDDGDNPDAPPPPPPPCDGDDECASGACNLATGACYAADEVVLIAPDGVTSGPCGDTFQPCGSISHAAAQMTETRHVARMLPGTYPSQIISQYVVPFTVDAHDTGIYSTAASTAGVFTSVPIEMTLVGGYIEVVTQPGTGTASRAVDIEPGSRVTLRNVVIVGSGVNSYGHGTTGIEVGGELTAERIQIRVADGIGISAWGSGARVVLRRSRVEQCKYGVLLGAPNYQLTDNLFAHNLMQGVRIDTAPGLGAKQLQYNTFLANGSQVTSGATELEVVRSGLEDSGLLFTPPGNLFKNGRAYSWNASAQTGLRMTLGAVQPRQSLFDMPNHPAFADGNVYADAALTADGHLTAGSPAIDVIEVGSGSPALFDLDGDPRPSGPRLDIGADEYAP